jgi:methylase of polypeptide subunit release factors
MTPTTRPHAFADHVALAALGRSLQAAGYRFVTVTPATHRRVNSRPENAWARDLRGVFGWSRPYRDGVLPAALAGQLEAAGLALPADPDDVDGGRRAGVRASTIGDRLYFHSAWPTCGEDDVFFGPDTYRYVAALKRTLGPHGGLRRPVRRAVDIGAGAGPGAIELALRCPDATVYATDINPAALALADINAGLNGADNVVPCRSDLLDGVDGGFDLVMSNPPYILDPDELTYRHGGGEHGAELSIRIVHAALDRLHPGGSLLLYTGVAIVDGLDPFLAAIRDRLDRDADGWSYEELDPDIFGGQLGCEGYEHVERIAAVWLHAVKRG